MNRNSKPPGVVSQRRRDDLAVQLADLHSETDVTRTKLRAMRGELGQERATIQFSDEAAATTVSSIMTEGIEGQVTRPQVEAALHASALPKQMPVDVATDLLLDGGHGKVKRPIAEAAFATAGLPKGMPGEEVISFTADGAKVHNFDKILNAAFGRKTTVQGIGIIKQEQQVRREAARVLADQLAHQQRNGPIISPRVVGANTDERVAQSPIFRRELTIALRQWLLTETLVLQSPHRCAHKGIMQLGLSTVRYRAGKRVEESERKLDSGLQVVMVEHDWARLFKSATFEGGGGGDEWQVPFDAQVYEFAISGAAVLGLTYTTETAMTLSLAIRAPKSDSWCLDQAGAVLTGAGWYYLDKQELIAQGEPLVNAAFDRLYEFIYLQIKAVAIMLESRVAEREVTRAPYKTNQPQRDAKPLPKLSHHVIRLSRDPRPAPLPAADRQHNGTRRRLHFRRGHWRHYSNHKTWIKWMLVGDPDLGFVDKEYRT